MCIEDKGMFVDEKFLVRSAFVRTNHRAILRIFVCLYVWDAGAL